uniref:Si:ch211-120k19.1 n=1 Tax=Petromyzon marinus TaxID=7757 RepID=S4R8V0_PETMA
TIATWVRRHSWLSSVAAFGILFAGADAVQQRFMRPPRPARHGLRAALLGLTFHGNFNYVWLRGLERAIPGSAARAVVVKVLADQTVAGPITISAFFTGMSLLEGKPDIYKDLRQKFWPTYKTGVVYWSAMQTINFTLVPPYARSVFVGVCAFLWTCYLCYVRQHSSGTDREQQQHEVWEHKEQHEEPGGPGQ